MKTIVYNNHNLKEEDITRVVKRAKAIIKNSKNQILLACLNNNYHLPGGHLEKDESFEDCLVREIEEEVGVDISCENKELILTITYYNRDYPIEGVNSKTIGYYYVVKKDLLPDLTRLHLTDDEIKGGFKLEFIDEDKILDYLYKSLENSTKKGAVKDTIEALKEYLK